MKKRQNRRGHARRTLVTLVCVACLAGIAWRATAVQNDTGAAPLKIAVVAIDDVIDNLDEFKEKIEQLQGKIDGRRAQLQELITRIERIETDIKERELTDEEKITLEIERFELVGQLQGRREALSQVTDLERGKLISEMYDKMVARIAIIADEENIDLVFVDDSRTSVPIAIPARRVLFARDSLDITERVKTDMNNAFKAGQ